MKIKVLPLLGCQKIIRQRDIEYYTETTPVFNRDGRYYDRINRIGWFEINGKAYIERGESFLFDLKLNEHKPLKPEAVSAIKTLKRERICPKELEELLELDCDWIQIKKQTREVRLRFHKFVIKNGIVLKKRKIVSNLIFK